MQNDIDSITKDYTNVEKILKEGKIEWARKEVDYEEKLKNLDHTSKIEKEKYFEKLDHLNNDLNSKVK